VALAERCRAGVGVNVLLDAVGALEMAPEDAALMTRSGCRVAYFRPLTHVFSGHVNNRDHRRILVVDGRIGFTGGAGAGDKWLGNGHTAGHWRETDVRIDGPAVHELQAAFARDWLAATGVVLGGPAYFPVLHPTGDVRLQVVTGAPARGNESLYTTFLLAIASARRSIHITNPYFLPDERMTRALLAAAARGVEVTVLLPGEIDHQLVRQASRAGFGRFLRGGVTIEEYQPALLHAKTMVIDGVWATVGSANFDNRSFALNAEVDVVAFGPDVARRLDVAFRDDLRYARLVRYRRWRARDLWSRFLEALAVPIRAQL
jgi:cardiolipin synthase